MAQREGQGGLLCVLVPPPPPLLLLLLTGPRVLIIPLRFVTELDGEEATVLQGHLKTEVSTDELERRTAERGGQECLRGSVLEAFW
jgi:hypothetical protein